MKVTEILETMDYGKAPEDPKPALEWIEKNGAKFGLYINGESNIPEGRESFETRNPRRVNSLPRFARHKRMMWIVPCKGRAAQADWEGIGGPARAKFLYAIARLVQKHSRLFAVIETLDNGKPIRESRDIDIPWLPGISISMPEPLS